MRKTTRLILSALAGIVLLVVIQPASAYASVVHKQSVAVAYHQAEQHLTVSREVAATVVARDDITVNSVTVVQWPGATGSLAGEGFGPRAVICSVCDAFHQGVDLLTGPGSKIEAIADGVVTSAGMGSGVGEYIQIQHNVDGQVLSSGYGHLQPNILVHVGETVHQGQVIGYTGCTGGCTGAGHLDFKILVGNTPINPMPWMYAHVNLQNWGGFK